MKFRVVPYKLGSASAKQLAGALTALLGYKVFRGKPKVGRININWGTVGTVNNGVEFAKNKLDCFLKLKAHDVAIPWFTSNHEEAQHKAANGMELFCRQVLNGHGGVGIELFTGQAAPLYVEYVKKKAEYRVHVFNGAVLDVQEKRKRIVEEGQPKADPKVRNLANGWVFCREDVNAPDQVKAEAVKAVVACGMLFGAVDVVWNEHYQRAAVLEVNSAPGLCETSAKMYANAFKEYFNA